MSYKKNLLLVSWFVLTFLVTGYSAPDVKKVKVAQCTLGVEAKGLLGSLSKKQAEEFRSATLVVTQDYPKTNSPVSPNFKVGVSAQAKNGKELIPIRWLSRVMALPIENGFVVSYSPAVASRGADSFLLAITEEGSDFMNFSTLAEEGKTYKLPHEVSCEVIAEPFEPEKGDEPMDVSRLSADELAQAIDNFIGRKTRRIYDAKGTLNLDRDQLNAKVAREVEKMNPGKQCQKVRSWLTSAVDYTGKVFGYRVSGVCNDIFREKVTRTTSEGKYVTPYYQGTHLYFDAGKRELQLQKPAKFERPGYSKWVKKENS
ncbi:MAG: hypothetical protein HY537_10680 [Deltaproteobacteria bacterium]|nr:hypothetical protein [Deltaproteobacteria bacterium]